MGVVSLPGSAAVMAGEEFEASGVALKAWFPPSAYPIESPGNDVWGYESPSGRQYAIAGTHEGTAFIEVTDPANSEIVGWVPGGNPGPTWRDMKTYLHYCYVVKDFDNLALQVIDLSDIDNGNVTLVNTTDLNSGFERAHNIAINEDTGFAYLIGSNLGGGGLAVVDLADPVNPVLVGNWEGPATGHDALIISYTEGPYAGREIAFFFGYSSGVTVVDVTEKDNMFTRSNLIYPNTSICHQGWVSEDRNWLFIGDEGDENPMPTTTYVADITNLDDITYETSFTTGLGSTDHNMMVRGNFLYCANYSSGLRIWDVSDVNAAVEVGYFDTFPEHNDPGFPGAWAPYVGWDNGIVVVNDRNRGLFVLDASAAIGGVVVETPARPLADAYVNGVCDTASCDTDADCGGESFCVSQADGSFPGQCYVPRNKFLALRANPENAGVNTARRVSVDTGFGPVVLGWVDQPFGWEVTGPECGLLGNNQLVSRISDTPFYTDWSALDSEIVLLGDCHISPGHTYFIEAIAVGGDTGDEGAYSAALTLGTTPKFGDVNNGGAVAGPPDGFANLVDVQSCILGFQAAQNSPKSWLELADAVPGLVVNLSDAFTAVLAFQGSDYPHDDPCTCAGLTACP
jgi:choice-of-anchor B domain-containing protein